LDSSACKGIKQNKTKQEKSLRLWSSCLAIHDQEIKE
jgi:hypothetical protein